MLNRIIERLCRPFGNAHRLFEPLFTLDEIEACGRMPIVKVWPFFGAVESSDTCYAGPGVGGLLANLLRRDLLLTRQVSVLGVEDTGFCQFARWLDDDPAINFESHTDGECDILVVGRLESIGASATSLEVRIVRPSNQRSQGFRIKFSHENVVKASIAVVEQVVQRLGLSRTPEVLERWRAAKPHDWESLCLAGACWESNNLRRLLALFKAGRVHADALVTVGNCEDLTLRHRNVRLAIERDPFNSQLLFYQLMTTWSGRNRYEPEAANLLRRALWFAPGHGKSHMCLPHVTSQISENAAYILAHSETGYRLLRTNSFALTNFSGYLESFAPDDPRVGELLLEAIERDPALPTAYGRAIEHLLARGNASKAYEIARTLLQLCTPPIDDRTLYGFRQNPEVAKSLDRGELKPRQYAQHYIDQCEEVLRRQLGS